jgi:hypothetical protein
VLCEQGNRATIAAMGSEQKPVERPLAAVLAADISGYSRLIGADEEGTLAALKAIRRSRLQLALELVEEAPIRGVSNYLVRARFD